MLLGAAGLQRSELASWGVRGEQLLPRHQQ